MGKMSRDKGRRGENELAGYLREYGYNAERMSQYCGKTGVPDVQGLPGIHIECKRVERLDLTAAMDQSKRDAREGEMPTVMHRKNHCEWLVTMRLEDWMRIYSEWDAANIPFNERGEEDGKPDNHDV